MKKLFINNKSQIIVKEMKDPIIETKGSIVKTSFALISSGTELSDIKMRRFHNLPFIKKVIKSKDFRNIIYNEIKERGILGTIKFGKLYLFKKDDGKNFIKPTSNLTPIGYSCSGLVQKTNLKDYQINDRVSCGGSNHAEIIYSPKNLTCKVPNNVTLEEAAFATLGAIALHGIHRADIKPGEFVGVIGTGLIGLVIVQLIKASGGRIVAFDLINKRLNLAKELGADFIINPKYLNSDRKVSELTNMKGLDSIIICATSKSSKILEDAVDLIRDRGKIVMLGGFPIEVNRGKLYYKEADLLISRSYGPGRYDMYYEYEGFDYPEEFVPWTEKRNMEFFLTLISEKKINVKILISDIIPVDKANIAYEKLENDPFNNIAILLKFTHEEEHLKIKRITSITEIKRKKLMIGLIGCGSFAQSTHLPLLLSNPNCKIKGICTEHKKTAELCLAKFHPDYITTNHKKILKDPEIDIVFIYTRHNTHGKFAIEALKAGKNVYCEKPMALTMNQCKEVYNTVKKTGKFYSIGFNRRYSPFIQIAKELLKKRDNPIIMNYRIANTFISGSHWVYDPNIGGGPIIGEFCHFTDLILYLIDSTPIEIYAKGGNLSHKNIEVYDSCTVLIEFKNGSIANLIYTDLGGPDIPKERIEIFSGESTIFIDDFKTMHTSGFDVGNKKLQVQDKGHKNELENVIKANLNEEESLIRVDDALIAMYLCFKTIDSIKNDLPIKITNDLNE